jgi:hypothetical protein
MVIAYNLCYCTIMGRLDMSDTGHVTTDRYGNGRVGFARYTEAETAAALQRAGIQPRSSGNSNTRCDSA